MDRCHCLALGTALAGFGAAAAIAASGPAWADPSAVGSADSAHTAVTTSATTAAKPLRWTSRASAARRAATSTAQPSLTVTRSGQSPLTLSSGRTGAAELSGITYAGDTTYYAVGDNGSGSIWQLYTSSDARDGRIRSALVTSAISAPALGSDSEGIALNTDRTRAWVTDEATSSISEFSLATGQKVGSVVVPAIYRPQNVQDNRGLEALSFGAGKLWTANEEALLPDGSLATTSAGSWVRLQSFAGPELAPQNQYGYLTDPISAMSPFVAVERSGLVDLVALPGGEVLALERELGGFLPLYRSRLYLLDFARASDVSELPSLADGGFTPVAKTLLWQGYFAFINFEGITLATDFGDSALLVLVSDDGGGELGQRQVVSSLSLRGAGYGSGGTPQSSSTRPMASCSACVTHSL